MVFNGSWINISKTFAQLQPFIFSLSYQRIEAKDLEIFVVTPYNRDFVEPGKLNFGASGAFLN